MRARFVEAVQISVPRRGSSPQCLSPMHVGGCYWRPGCGHQPVQGARARGPVSATESTYVRCLAASESLTRHILCHYCTSASTIAYFASNTTGEPVALHVVWAAKYRSSQASCHVKSKCCCTVSFSVGSVGLLHTFTTSGLSSGVT